MRDVLVTWVLPTTRTEGGELLVTEIQHVEIQISGDLGNSYAVLSTVPTSARELLVPDLEFGEWRFRGIVVDTQDRRSTHLEGSIVLADDSAPSPLVSLVVAVNTV